MMICKVCKIETQTPFKDNWCTKSFRCEDCMEKSKGTRSKSIPIFWRDRKQIKGGEKHG